MHSILDYTTNNKNPSDPSSDCEVKALLTERVNKQEMLLKAYDTAVASSGPNKHRVLKGAMLKILAYNVERKDAEHPDYLKLHEHTAALEHRRKMFHEDEASFLKWLSNFITTALSKETRDVTTIDTTLSNDLSKILLNL